VDQQEAAAPPPQDPQQDRGGHLLMLKIHMDLSPQLRQALYLLGLLMELLQPLIVYHRWDTPDCLERCQNHTVNMDMVQWAVKIKTIQKWNLMENDVPKAKSRALRVRDATTSLLAHFITRMRSVSMIGNAFIWRMEHAVMSIRAHQLSKKTRGRIANLKTAQLRRS
jgi:hypothetical protein